LSWDLYLKIGSAAKFILIVSFLISLSFLSYVIISSITLTEQKNNEQILQSSSSLLSPLFFASAHGQTTIREIPVTEFPISIHPASQLDAQISR
jgi:hypothetical protein